jgi:hypothetical protein
MEKLRLKPSENPQLKSSEGPQLEQSEVTQLVAKESIAATSSLAVERPRRSPFLDSDSDSDSEDDDQGSSHQPQGSGDATSLSSRTRLSDVPPSDLTAYLNRPGRQKTHLDDLLGAMARARATSSASFMATLSPENAARYTAMEKRQEELKARRAAEKAAAEAAAATATASSPPTASERVKSEVTPALSQLQFHPESQSATKSTTAEDLASALGPLTQSRRVTVPASALPAMRPSSAERTRFGSGLFGSLTHALPFTFPSREKKSTEPPQAHPLTPNATPDLQKEGSSETTTQSHHVVELHSPQLRPSSQPAVADSHEVRRDSQPSHYTHSAHSSRSSNTYVSSAPTSKEPISPSFTDPTRPLFSGYESAPAGIRNGTEWMERQRAKDLRQAQRLHKALKEKRDGLATKLLEAGRDGEGNRIPHLNVDGDKTLSPEEASKVVQDIKSVDESLGRVEKDIVAHGGEIGAPIVYHSPTSSQFNPEPAYNPAAMLPTPPLEFERGSVRSREGARDPTDMTEKEKERDTIRLAEEVVKEQQRLTSQQKFIANTPESLPLFAKGGAMGVKQQSQFGLPSLPGTGINWGVLTAVNRAGLTSTEREERSRQISNAIPSQVSIWIFK